MLYSPLKRIQSTPGLIQLECHRSPRVDLTNSFWPDSQSLSTCLSILGVLALQLLPCQRVKLFCE